VSRACSAALALVVVLGACVVGDDARTEVIVSAAASLTDVFADMAEAFERDHPAYRITLNLGGSSALREQIVQGAAVDVFASADAGNMEELVAAGIVAQPPRVFARNVLEVAVPSGNPAGVGGLADLADPSLFVGICAPGVPCGDLARRVLAADGVDAAVDTLEPDVRSLVTKIAEGELDAGLVYVTDVVAESGVEGIAIPGTADLWTDYQIASLATSPHPDGASAFVEFVLSARGRDMLLEFGFAAP
jgi:molybdate transport system substrate-binding protein